ncbi:MAG: hypothetical protein KME27_10835 [Lyngbya sp. HA4199-MV5]|jgi:hypothetical protein|nr:hypothetical protein [Lyngbya sp. HA4199-MV5]
MSKNQKPNVYTPTGAGTVASKDVKNNEVTVTVVYPNGDRTTWSDDEVVY